LLYFPRDTPKASPKRIPPTGLLKVKIRVNKRVL
jgi:hypothetical protein